jgi:hypothetical protein
MRLAAALFVVVAGIPRFITAQQATGVISGSVLADQSLRPLAAAQVSVVGTRLGALTDANGRFRLTGVTGDSVTLDVRLIGFQPAKAAARVGDATVRVLLTEVARWAICSRRFRRKTSCARRPS